MLQVHAMFHEHENYVSVYLCFIRTRAYVGMTTLWVILPGSFIQTLDPPLNRVCSLNLALICQAVLETGNLQWTG